MSSSLIIHRSHSRGPADGGVASAVEGLVQAQRQRGLNTVWQVDDHIELPCRDPVSLATLIRAHPSLVHIHGLWRSPTRVARLLQHSGIPLVISPHGMLDPWALRHNRWKKRMVWWLCDRDALVSAKCLHALCQAEAKAFGTLGLGRPIALIPNGVPLPDLSPPAIAALPPPPWHGTVPADERVLLFLGRLHAKKGIAPLLAAWERCSARRTGWWLVMVGYGDGGATATQVMREGLERCLVFGPCFGARKDSVLANASAFVLPSFSEGLPMAALEAMSWQLPCLLSAACNLPETFAAGCALPAEPDSDALAASLQRFFVLTEAERRAMGAAGRDMVSHRFSWPRVAADFSALYSWVLDGGAPPVCVTMA